MDEKLKQRLDGLPDKPGIYFFKNPEGRSSTSARPAPSRTGSAVISPRPPTSRSPTSGRDGGHRLHPHGFGERGRLLENNFVQRYQPKFNLRLKDDKSFPYLKLTLGERFRGSSSRGGRGGRRPLFRPVQPRLPGPQDHFTC